MLWDSDAQSCIADLTFKNIETVDRRYSTVFGSVWKRVHISTESCAQTMVTEASLP